jgi:hypothetical protein
MVRQVLTPDKVTETSPAWSPNHEQIAFPQPHRLPRVVAPPIHLLRELHSGAVGDYATWVVAVGTAVVGGVWAVPLHG